MTLPVQVKNLSGAPWLAFLAMIIHLTGQQALGPPGSTGFRVCTLPDPGGLVLAAALSASSAPQRVSGVK